METIKSGYGWSLGFSTTYWVVTWVTGRLVASRMTSPPSEPDASVQGRKSDGSVLGLGGRGRSPRYYTSYPAPAPDEVQNQEARFSSSFQRVHDSRQKDGRKPKSFSVINQPRLSRQSLEGAIVGNQTRPPLEPPDNCIRLCCALRTRFPHTHLHENLDTSDLPH